MSDIAILLASTLVFTSFFLSTDSFSSISVYFSTLRDYMDTLLDSLYFRIEISVTRSVLGSTLSYYYRVETETRSARASLSSDPRVTLSDYTVPRLVYRVFSSVSLGTRLVTSPRIPDFLDRVSAF